MLSNAGYRRLCLNLLDDPNGISEEAYDLLRLGMEDNGCQDIAEQVEAVDGRFFINENYTEAELAKMDAGVEIEDNPLPPIIP